MSNEQQTEKQVVSVTISTETFNAIGNYLVTRPWAEVDQLIKQLQSGNPVFAEEETEEAASKAKKPKTVE